MDSATREDLIASFQEFAGKYVDQGVEQGREQARREVLVRLLAQRFGRGGRVDEATRQRIERAELDELDRWLDKVIPAVTKTDVVESETLISQLMRGASIPVFGQITPRITFGDPASAKYHANVMVRLGKPEELPGSTDRAARAVIVEVQLSLDPDKFKSFPWYRESVHAHSKSLKSLRKYEYQSEFAKKHFGWGLEYGREQGRREILARLLVQRFGRVDRATRQRIEEANLDELDRWLDRVIPAETMADVFESQ